MATTAPPADDDLPECPVCLSPFDAVSAVPRVLPCGHSLCGPCIAALPPASASSSAGGGSSIRCPLCSQCVPFSRALGPSSLPKNLALIALLPSPPRSAASHIPTATAPPPLPLPLHAAHSRLLSRFRYAVLPESASPLRSAATPTRLAFGSLDSDLGAPWFCARGRPVSLLSIETHPSEGGPPTEQEAVFYRPSHAARVLAALGALSDAAREELAGLIASSARLARRVCRVYGVWMAPDAPPLWMVSERHPRSAALLLEEEMINREETVIGIGFVAMEACEAIMSLHGEGLVLGCLGLDCFCLDHFGHCLLDLNQTLTLCRRIQAGASAHDIGAFIAPEVAAVLADKLQRKDHDFDGLIGCSSDVWSLGCVLVALLTRDEELVAGWNSEALYDDWEKEVVTRLDASLLGTQLESLAAIIASCLRYDPKCRPEVADVWKCIRGLLMKSCDVAVVPDDIVTHKSLRCVLLGELSSMFADSCSVESDDKTQLSQGAVENSLNQDDGSNGGFLNNRGNDLSGINGQQSAGVVKSSTLLGHRDCVTGLTIGAGLLFSSSYDKTINVWSLQLASTGNVGGANASAAAGSQSDGYYYDYSLRCTMTGHKSTVSCLVVASGILYSGSWDGTIRSWWLTDHTPLSVLEDDTAGSIAPVLSISTEGNFVASSYENGYFKIWKNDVLVKSEKLQNGAIYAVKLSGKWLYTGGWDKVINIQELLEVESEIELQDIASITCDSIITSILSWDERLIVGLSSRDIMVYHKAS
ncbi:hypothetical protein U9M48_044094 [Paspalum notatum var. saurae]|uniref:Uncharacterized protein n=1 Tax=Paspalum notatum var. saurae TaxID=547442 RepID=A0AAQ3UWB3_PASNO